MVVEYFKYFHKIMVRVMACRGKYDVISPGNICMHWGMCSCQSGKVGLSQVNLCGAEQILG